jgi:protein ImuA
MRIGPTPVRDSTAPDETRRWASGIAALDTALAGGLGHGRVHEIYAAEIGDAAAAAGFSLAIAAGMADGRGAIVWLRSRRSTGQAGVLQGNGWAEMGAIPENALITIVADNMALLRAAADAVRCAALGAVVVEGWGRLPEMDLTASRRLALAAEKSGVPLLLLRADAVPTPSAAQTRWQVAAAPSRALPGQAPGLPAFDLILLRQKSGPSGLHWRLEWDRDQRQFRDAALSGAVVRAPVDRPVADRNAAPRQAA